MSTTSVSTSAGGATSTIAPEESFVPHMIVSLTSSDLSLSSASLMTQTISFSSGNPKVEEIRGIMHLYRDNLEEPSTSVPDLPIGRKPLVCVLDVPNHMTYADFCQFCGSFIQSILEMRIVRTDEKEGRYSIIISFDNQNSTDSFHRHFNGCRFSSLEVETCRVLFMVDVQYTASIEHAQILPASSVEQPTCPVCLERLDQEISGTLTTICNHSFHCSCISKWTDSSCPVCRYCQQEPEKSKCSICETSVNLWMCLICGFVGCGRYKEGHAVRHWKETQHCYSVELETQRVWDFVGDNYVHRLIQSKTDGKLVELNSHCVHTDGNCGGCECSAESGIQEALFNSKVETVVVEYNDLLTSQLENQRKYYESLLTEIKDDTDRKIAIAVEKVKNLRRLKVQQKLNKCIEEKKFQENLHENLKRNVELWRISFLKIEEREQKALHLREQKIINLENQLRDLMMRLEAESSVEQPPTTTTEISKTP